MFQKSALRVFVFLIVVQFSYFSLASHKIPLIPDTRYTTGDLCDTKNLDFKNYRYSQRIPYCARNVSYETKELIYNRYNIPKNARGQYTIDHFIPLSIGGSNDVTNLWPEHKKIKETRIDLELNVFHAVRDGEMTQSQAIEIIENAKFHPDVNLGSDEL